MFSKLLPFLIIFIRESHDRPETPPSPCWEETESSLLGPSDFFDEDVYMEDLPPFLSLYSKAIKTVETEISLLSSFFGSHDDENNNIEDKRPLSFYAREAENVESEIPLLSSYYSHDDDEDDIEDELSLSPHLQAIKSIEYECGFIPAAKNIYVKKKPHETDHEKIIRGSKNSQILMCKSAMENTDDLKSIIHYKKIMENIHRRPDNEVQMNINNLYSFHRIRILSKRN